MFAGSQIISLLVITGAVWVCRRFLDRRSFSSLGLKLNRQTIYDLVAGLLITAVIMELIFLLMRTMGWLAVDAAAWNFISWNQIAVEMTIMFLMWVAIGWQEELLVRGYLMQNLASGLNMLVAVILSSLLFGLMHLLNPGAGWTGVVGIFFAGLFLAYAYLRTRSLWLPIGLHIGWNFFEGTVFGFPVSGASGFGLMQINIQGPELITGGVFGPEAGLIILPALLIGAGLIYIYTRGRSMLSYAEIMHWSFDDREPEVEIDAAGDEFADAIETTGAWSGEEDEFIADETEGDVIDNIPDEQVGAPDEQQPDGNPPV